MLKSRLFLGSFFLLLFSCWASCLFLIVIQWESLEYLECGDQFCTTYYIFLMVPLCIVAPLSIFAVTAQERIEKTLETLAMTTLKRKQIINGYFWCGIIQAGLFYSAVVPFISFGYLLKGVGIAQILIGMIISILFSTVSGVWSLMLGTLVRSSFSHTVCLIFSLLGGLIAFGVSASFLNLLFLAQGSNSLWGGEFLCGFLCMGLPAFFFLFIFLDIADRQIRIKDPTKRPYQVILDQEGNILRFKRPPNGMFDEVPELLATIKKQKTDEKQEKQEKQKEQIENIENEKPEQDEELKTNE